jgi:hypothetical protein
MRNGIHLQPGRFMLVCRGIRAPADAARWRGLPVPRLFAQGGGASHRKHAINAKDGHCGSGPVNLFEEIATKIYVRVTFLCVEKRSTSTR